MTTPVRDMTPKQTARFWGNAQQAGECLEWTRHCNAKGYGKVNIRGKIMRTHRVAYELEHGPIPEGMQVDHTCHNPPCIKAGHLRLATHKENQENRKGATKGNRSGVRGVNWHALTGKWTARVTHHHEVIYLGIYATIAEAEAVVIAKRLELFTHNDVDRATIPGGIMNDARDELAKVIVTAYGEDADVECPCEQDLEVADAILAAGFTRPRIIETAEELEALGHGSVIRSQQRHYWVAHKEDGMGADQGWAVAGSGAITSRELTSWLPASVLYEPEGK